MRRQLILGGLSLVARSAAAAAQVGSAADEVVAANAVFDAALSRRDLSSLEALCLREDGVTAAHPRDRSPTVGWAAVRRSWEETFARFSELSVAMPEPRAQVFGDMAIVVGLENIRGRRASDGVTVTFDAMTTNVFQRGAGRWLLVHHHATMLVT